MAEGAPTGGTASGQPRSWPFGITPDRVRGVIGLTLIMLVVYFTLLENDPPPVFTEVEIRMQEQPAAEGFDEHDIVMPDFRDSPALEDADATPADGVAITGVENDAAPGLVREEPAAGETPPAPAEVTRPDEERQVDATPTVPAAPAADPPPAPPPLPLDPAQRGFYVQVIAVGDKDKALQTSRELSELLGEPTYVQQVLRRGEPLYRVRFGPFGADQGKANEVLRRLAEKAPSVGEHAYVDED